MTTKAQRDYTVKEAAERLGVTGAAINMAILRGRLLAWKRAGAYFIDADELERWRTTRKLSGPRGAARKGTL